MDRGDLSVPVDEERGRQRIHAAVKLGRFAVADHHAVVHAQLRKKRLHGFPAIIVHGDAQHRESLVLVSALEVHEPGDLDLARAAPGGPEIQQHHFTAIIREANGLAVHILQRKIRGLMAVLVRLDRPGSYGTRPGRPEIYETPRQESDGDSGREAACGHRFLSPIQLYRQSSGFDPPRKPGAAAGAAAARERKLMVPRGAGIQPRGGVAEALAAILPPSASAALNIVGSEGAFSPLRRPAQLAARARLPFTLHQALVGVARRVAQPRPDEVKQLMDEDAREFRPAAIERHTALSHKRSGVHRAAGPRGHPAQGVRALDADGRARDRRQTAQYHPHLFPAGGVLEQKKMGNRHSPRLQDRESLYSGIGRTMHYALPSTCTFTGGWDDDPGGRAP